MLIIVIIPQLAMKVRLYQQHIKVFMHFQGKLSLGKRM